MRVVIFGATGFIGSHIAEQFAISGAEVICPVRANSHSDFLRSLAAELDLALVELDFANESELAALMQGADCICNCIADTRIHASLEQKHATEVELSLTLLRLAHQAQVKHFIQLSSIMRYGFNRPLKQFRVVSESSPVGFSFNYNLAVAARESALEDFQRLHTHSATNLILLQPANTTGKRDSDFLPAFLQAAKFGVFPAMYGGTRQFSCIDTRDIGRAAVLLSQQNFNQNSQRFLVKGYDLAWNDLKQALEAKFGKALKLMPMPNWLMQPLATLLEWLTPLGVEPPLTRFSLNVLGQHMKIDDSAIRQLGFAPKYQLQDSISDCAKN